MFLNVAADSASKKVILGKKSKKTRKIGRVGTFQTQKSTSYVGQRTDFFKVPERGEPKLQYKRKILKKKFGHRVR